MVCPKALHFLLCITLWNTYAVSSTQEEVPNLILILVDGFRWDYTELHKGVGLPGFNYFISKGIRAKYLNPVFPANSFPNWHTIVTGLYPETHGILNNFMYDPESGNEFNLYDLDSTKDADWWSDAEPLWITTTKSDIDTGLFYWSRCDVPFDGVLPKYCLPYDYAAAKPHYLVKHLHQALDMIQGDQYRFIMLYTGHVDMQGHHYGPESPEVGAAVREVDAVLQGLWEALETREMANDTNVVILSDHGMAALKPNDVEIVDITSCVDREQVQSATGYGGYMNILPAPGYAQQVVDTLKDCPDVENKLDIYLKDDMDEQYHYRAHRLIHDVHVIAKPGFSIELKGDLFLPGENAKYAGDHGIDNTFDQSPNMRGVLYATGPSFGKGVETGVVDQVDVYGLLCRVLELEDTCHENNGTVANIERFFVPPETSSSPATFLEFTLGVLVFVISIFFLLTFGVLLNAGL